MSRQQILRFVAWAAAVAVGFFVFLWIGFAVQSSRAWHAGEKAFAEGNETAALADFERSIRNHCPLNVWGKRSASRLRSMAEEYESKGEIERAIEAYERLMTALAATDTGWSRSRRATIEQLEQRIMTLRRERKSKSASPLEKR